MKKFVRLGQLFTGFAILTLLFDSCTVYYKTTDIKKTFSLSQREVNKALGKIAKDRREKRGIYNQITVNIPDSSVSPYPELAAELVKMGRSLNQLKQTARQLEQMKANFNRLVKGRKKIESGSSLWDDFQVIKLEYDLQTGTFESQAATYNNASNNFTDLLNQYKISKLDVVEVRQKIDAYLAELNQSIQIISSELEKNRVNPDMDKNIFKRLEAIVTDIELEQRSLEELVLKFENEVGDEPQIWSGPGMLSHSILADMKMIGDKISAHGKAFNKLTQKL